MKKVCMLAIVTASVVSTFAQSPCVDGLAGGLYPCENVDLLKFMPTATIGGGNTNDIWGWTDPDTGKEYALVGRTSGTSFVDISDPVNPVYLGNLPKPTTNSTWRDVKVYNNHAFIVSEATGSGMQVFDLTRLRDVLNPPVVFTSDAFYNSFSRAHNIAINEETGFAYVVGSNTFSGGLHIINIQNPLNPVLAGDYALDGYTHDAQIVVYQGLDTDYIGRQIAFCSNEDAITVVDVTDPTDTQTISVNPYDNSAYTHQCWLTEDHRYLLVCDELDETNLQVNTTTFIWDMADLDNPQMIGTYVSTEAAIDHNLYTRGNLVYLSSYRAGLRILDSENVENSILSEVAFFDIYPANNNANFNGSWSNYPYFASGVVILTGIETGLYIVKPNFIRATSPANPACATELVTIDIDVLPGFMGPVNLSVSGLPNGVEATFSENDVYAPATIQLTLNGFPNEFASYPLTITGTGAHYSYQQTAIVDIEQATAYYSDNDGDSFGDINALSFACLQPAGYVTNADDCDDSNNQVYPEAAPTAQGLDNNCDGAISEAEQAPCLGDFNNDLSVNVGDLLILLSEMGCLSNCNTDITGDNQTTSNDLLSFLTYYGTTCP
jgi:choice-of-anchor B domain-containing protein